MEALADAMVEADLAKLRVGYTVIQTLDLVERLVDLQQLKLQLLASRTHHQLTDLHHQIELETAFRKASLEKDFPFREPLGYKITNIIAIGEKFAASPSFLEPTIYRMWSAAQGTPSIAML